jgi:3-hydroxyisobutyrate dehydrogenase-like beta-hydroxyacid dehydrogenase
MGSAIAANIITKGLPTTVWNRTAAKAEPMAKLGAKTAPTAKQAVQDADIVVTSLMDDQSILDLLHAADGILAGMQQGATHLCITTISPLLADDLTEIHRKHGSRYVSGPVVGRPAQADAGKLRSYLSGDPEGLPLAQTVAEKYCDGIRVVKGPASAANTIKLCLNYSALSIIEMIGEVYTFAEKSGAEPEVVNEFYQAVFAHPAIKEYANIILGRDFHSKVGFTLLGGQKDMSLMLDLAAQRGVELDIGRIIAEKMAEAIKHGLHDADWTAFTEISRQRAGL